MTITIPNGRVIDLKTKAGGGFESAGIPGSPPGALTMGTPTKTSTSITGVVIDGNGSTSYQTRVDGGTPVSGLTKSGLSADTLHSVEWRGQNEVDFGPWTTPVNVTTDAAGGSILDPLAHGNTVNFTATNGGARTVTTYETVIGDSGHIEQTALTSADQNFGNWRLGKGSDYGANASDIEIINDPGRGKVWYSLVRPGGSATEYNGAIQINYAAVPEKTKMRVSYWVKNNITASSPSGQWKMFRITKDSTSGPPAFNTFNWYGSGDSVDYSPGDVDSGQVYWTNYPSSDSSWIKYIVELETSDQGVQNGALHLRHVTSSGVGEITSTTDREWGPWPAPLETYSGLGRLSRFYLQNYSGNGLGEMEIWHDDVSIQVGSWSSIEIGNNQVYSQCTVLEDQEIISWVQSGSDADISFKVNEGGLSAGNYWLHVKDDSGTVVDSIAVEIQ